MCDIERIELNEAFAAIPTSVAQELGLAEDIVNVVSMAPVTPMHSRAQWRHLRRCF
jgi:hypothetical protein